MNKDMSWKMFCFYHLRMTFTQNKNKSTDGNETPSIVCDKSLIVMSFFTLKKGVNNLQF